MIFELVFGIDSCVFTLSVFLFVQVIEYKCQAMEAWLVLIMS